MNFNSRIKMLRSLLWIQGLYILATAVWPLVSIKTFMEVTGPKTDIWLVKTVAVLLIPIAACFLFNTFTRRPHVSVMVVGLTVSAGLSIIDFYYTYTDTIKWVYAVDGCIELIFLVAWIYLLFRNVQNRPTG
jgi:hypothetical protein